jgi:ammonium transporter, Amt family
MTPNLLVLLGALGLLVPVGAVLWSAGANRDPAAPPAGFYVLAAVALGVIGSLTAGFALQFGGAAGLYPALGELSALGDRWTPLANVLGSGWALAGASGFFLAVGDDPGAYALFVFQMSQLIAGLSVIAIACAGRVRPVRAVSFALVVVLFGWLLYPLAGGWTWGGGWLSTLGKTEALGHGLVDFGGSGAIHLAAGAVALAGALAWGRLPGLSGVGRPSGGVTAPAPVSPATTDRAASPLCVAGALAMSLGWLALLAGSAVLTGTSLPVVMINGLVAGAAGSATALGYMGFTTGRADDAMGARGLVAGLVAISAAVPFISPAAALLIGAVAGLLVCLATHLVWQSLRLDDQLGVVSVHGVGGLWGLLAVGIFAHGHAGAGWNGVGIKEYLGVAAQGVTGLSPAGGLATDPGQMQAQLIGAVAILALALVPTWLLFWLARRPASALADEDSGAPAEGQAEA